MLLGRRSLLGILNDQIKEEGLPGVRSAADLAVDEAARWCPVLNSLHQYRSTPHSIVLRIDVVLGASEGIANHVLAGQLPISLPAVLQWRRRYESEGITGILKDHPHLGRPKTMTAEKEAAIVKATLRTQRPEATHWSVRMMAEAQHVSAATVHRIWRRHHLHAHPFAVMLPKPS